MVVIIGAVPGTLRSGLSATRSMSAPRPPVHTMVIGEHEHQNADERSAVEDACSGPTSPIACITHKAMNEPTMKTLKWAKLISSMMP